MQETQLLEELKGTLRPYLRAYLESRKIQISPSGHFHCINPKHPDKATASCHIVPGSNDTHWVCFGCGATGDVFSAAHWLEGLPLRGKEFITENVHVLAARFSIPFEQMMLSERDIYMMNLRQLYRHASDTLVEFADQRALLDRRGWSQKLCYDMRVGTVKTWQDFRNRLMAKGDYTVKYLEDNGIYENLFNPYCITFTIFDQFGHPVGFGARDSRWGTVQNIHKFRVTETRIPIFNKREILYGLHVIKNSPVRPTVVEGYSDVLTAMEAGIPGFVGILTSTITDEQLAILRKHGKNDLDLALDYDFETKTGQTKTEECLDDVLSGRKNIRVQVVDFGSKAKPGESLDPDEFIRQQADPRTAWEALPKVDAFEWRLQRLKGEPADWVAEKMIKLILNEPQHARQELMLKKLSSFTGVRVEALQADLDDQLWETDRRRRDEARGIQDELVRKLKYADPLKVDTEFDEAAKKIRNLRRDTKAIVTVNTSMEMVDMIQEKFLNKGEGLPGLKTNWDKFDTRIGGLPKEDCFMVLGGIPHSGKTSYFCHLGWNVAYFNEEVCVLYMSIDDSMSQIYPKLVAIQTGLPIDWISQPKRWLRDKGQMDRLNEGWSRVKSFVQSGRLEVRDNSFGTSVNYLESWIEAKKKEYPGRSVVAFLDNFHKLTEGGASIRERFRNASEHLKNISQSGRTTIAVTAELTKGTDPKNPTLRDLMECVPGHTLVEDQKTGQLLRVDQVQPGMMINCFDNESHKVRTAKVRKVIRKNKKPCLKFTTKQGRVFESSARHAWFVNNKWIFADDISLGDTVGVARKTLTQGSFLSPDLARLLGYFVGDGNFKQAHFVNKDPGIIRDVLMLGEAVGTTARRGKHNRSHTLTFSGGPVGKGLPRPENRLKSLFKTLGLYGVTGEGKRVPDIVFGMDHRSSMNFVGACTATDGCISLRSNAIIVMDNKSRQLLEGLRTLLLRIGVPTSLHGDREGMYRLKTIGGLSVAQHLAHRAPIAGRKGLLKEKFRGKPETTPCKLDTLPMPMTDEAVARWKASGLPAKCLGNEGHIIPNRRMTPTRARIVARALDWPELCVVADGDLMWDEIVSIEQLPAEPMWDLEVAEHHNFFLANGVLAHNTVQLEHDATIAALFHNDLQVDSGSDCSWIDSNEPIAEDRRKPLAELRIAKNKNIDGAFKGTIRYRFNPKISFFTEDSDDDLAQRAGGLEKPSSSSGQAFEQGTLIEP